MEQWTAAWRVGLFRLFTSRGTRRTHVTTIALALALTCLIPSNARGATFNIAAEDVAGLMAAIQTANASCAATTTINLAPGGTYTLTAVAESPGEYNGPGAAGLPVIRVSITINGNPPGSRSRRSRARS